MTELASGLEAPAGVVFGPDSAAYATESGASRVVGPAGQLSGPMVSFARRAAGSDRTLYL